MRKYKCHKIVEAGQLVFIGDPDEKGGREVTVTGEGPCYLAAGFFARGVPELGDYLVRYEPDGYMSWSPQKVFQAGYTAEPNDVSVSDEDVTAAYRVYADVVGFDGTESGLLRAKCAAGLRAVLESLHA